MFERFTPAARDVVIGAQQQARDLHHHEILAEHLLLAVLDEGGTGAAVLHDAGVQREALVREVTGLGAADEAALRAIGVDLVQVRERAEAAFGPGALDRPVRRRTGLSRHLPWLGGSHLPFTAPAKRALEQSLRQALDLGHRHLGSEHVLLGLLAGDRDPAALTVSRLGADPAAVRRAVRERLQHAA